MTIALVVTNLRGGGAEKSMLRLADVLSARGHPVKIILLEHIVEHPVPRAVELHGLTDPGTPRSKSLLGKLMAACALRRLYARLGLDSRCLTVSTLPFADEVVATARIPNAWFRITNTLSAEVEELRSGGARKAERRLARYRKLYGRRNLVAVSQGVADDLRCNLGLRDARIVRIFNGFDFASIRHAAAQPDGRIPAEPFVLHVGRFTPQKRHDLLLDAWAEARLPCRLVLLTHPNPQLDALIASRGLQARVMVAGFQSNPYPWMRAAKLLVLCSDREGMPSVLIEALACGTRVVSTDCPSGPREVLRGELCRWLVPCGQAGPLARGLRNAFDAPPLAVDTILDDFTEDRMAAAYEALAEAD